MNSLIVGVMFALIASAARPTTLVVSVLLGATYGLAVWVAMRFGLLPLNDGEGALFTMDRVSPKWV